MTDKEILRQLATEYMEIATLAKQKETMNLIKAFNRKDKVRPIVTIFQLPWNELVAGDEFLKLKCENKFLRNNVEMFFRREIYRWNNYQTDMPLEPVLKIPYAVNNTGYGLKIEQKILATDPNNSVKSHAFINQFEDFEDLDKIKEMKITLNEKLSVENKDLVENLIGDIIPIHQEGGANIRTAFWDILAEMMSVEEIYYQLIDQPEFLHALMDRLTNSALAGIKQMNELKLAAVSNNYCHCSPIYTDELLPDFVSTKEPLSYNTWACAMAQLFTSTSPAVTEEFEIPYISKIAKEFGMFYYGCCERLDDRLDIVQKIPNLRKVSCSPWSDKEKFAQNLDPKIIMSVKPTPAYLAMPDFDSELIRKDLIQTCEIAKSYGLNVELLLKDVSTLKNDPTRLTRWAKIAMEVVNNY
ncbi:MAG: hypothetical protein ATN31_09325 [Candidatus Epulonipiscioides saccharophilum]|nr:MAG: hypothetical protein ATN31_09325 [Epulopiscium sp. AS2M-Bin001]